MRLTATDVHRTCLATLVLKLCIVSALAAIFMFQPGTGYFQSGAGHSVLLSVHASGCGSGSGGGP
jgi:hypothetical protein